jgi:hypothetical protein
MLCRRHERIGVPRQNETFELPGTADELRARTKIISHSGAGAGLQDTNATEMRRA